MRNTYLVCDDIADDFRRARVLKTMKGFGDHLQYSVFECQLNGTDLARCRHALSQVIHHKDDQVLFVNLGPVEGRGDRVISALGRPYTPLDAPCIVIDGSERPGAQSRIAKANEERAARHARGEE
jgi:CRISPR-associated protein Cas2